MTAFVGGTGVGYPTPLTQIGLAIEQTKGTLEDEPTYMIKTKAPKYDPKQAVIPDDTIQGSMVAVYDEILGMRYDSHGWDSFVYLDSFPLLVCMELGSPDNITAAGSATTLAAAADAGTVDITTGASLAVGDWVIIGAGATLETHLVASGSDDAWVLATPLINDQAEGATVTPLTVHQFSLLNNANQGQPPSGSLWDYDSEEWRTMTACQLDELTIKGNATGLVDYTCTIFGNAAGENASAPSASFTDSETAEPWTLQALIGGEQVIYMEDWEFDFKRGVTAIPALTGTKEYFEYLASSLQATAKFTFVEQSGSPITNAYLNGTKQSFDLTVFDPEGDALNIHTSSAMFTTAPLDRSSEYGKVTADLQLLPTSADALAGGTSPVIITIANEYATSYWEG